MNYWSRYERASVLRQHRTFVLAGCGLALSFTAGSAFAQAAASAEPKEEVLLEEVQVTASRVGRAGYSAPTPTTVLDAEQIAAQGATNIAQMLNQLPELKATTTPTTNGIRAATPGANFANMRGLGPTRTLVLVDGRRFVPQVATVLPGYQVDMNQIPALLIQRTDVVTGGASAQWGSDAVAGVINLVLAKNFQGFKAELQGGASEYGDDQEYRAGFLAGTSLLGGRGHVEVAFDVQDNNGTGDANSRPWGRKGYQVQTNNCGADQGPFSASAACGGVFNGQPNLLISPDVRFSAITPGGLILDGPLAGTQFGPGGAAMPFKFGQYTTGTDSMVGGDDSNFQNNIISGVSLENWVHREVGFGRFAYDVSDTTSVFVEGLYSDTAGGGQSLPPRDTGSRANLIQRDNAFLPATIAQAMDDAGVTSFTMGRYDDDIGRQQTEQQNTTKRFVVGAEGAISGNWNWDLSYVYGRNRYYTTDIGNRLLNEFALAVDAVRDPLTGAAVCRSTLTNPSNGCVPLNLFGSGAPSEAAKRYVVGTSWQETVYKQEDVSANLRGTPFNTWAGPVSIAVGLEYRSEKEASDVDPRALTDQYEGTNAREVNGEFNVKEAYLEAVVPLVSDQTWARSLELNGAVRYADYSTSAGNQTPWKVGLTYTPISGLLFRAARSRDIRAPNIYELFAPPLPNTFSAFGRLVTVVDYGTPTNKPEVSDTLTAGVSYQLANTRLQMSADYFDIKLKDGIGQEDFVGRYFACLGAFGSSPATAPAFCSSIGVDMTLPPNPVTIQVPWINLNTATRRGIDASLSYRTNAGALGIPGVFSFNVNGEYLLQYTDGNSVDRTGDQLGSPKYRAVGTIGYDVGDFSAQTVIRYIGNMKYDNTYIEGGAQAPGDPNHINDNSIPSITYFDLSASYKVSPKFQVFGVIRNLANKAPPNEPAIFFGYPTNPTYYDMIGRTYRLGVRYNVTP